MTDRKIDFYLTDHEYAAFELGNCFFSARRAAYERKRSAVLGIGATVLLALFAFGMPAPGRTIPFAVATFAMIQALVWWSSDREYVHQREEMEKIVMSFFKENR